MKAPIFEDKKIEFWPPGIDYPFISRDEFNNKNVIPKDTEQLIYQQRRNT